MAGITGRDALNTGQKLGQRPNEPNDASHPVARVQIISLITLYHPCQTFLS